MSKIGKQEIKIPTGIKVSQEAGVFTVVGPKGTLKKNFRDDIVITITPEMVTLAPKRNDKFSKSLWGTYASHIKNMVAGVTIPYVKKLILEGVGFKSEVKGKDFHFALGFSHPVVVKIPDTITATADKNNITITGPDKELVGSFAATIRALKKPEPYKGKGMRYEGEVIRRKQGKKTA
ncbi:50S ribosomal protein L6 [Candidatus Nomurabacteria bacterium RIFCSPLOWO2_02_FULL_44_12]|uniref:50S ribosomal protein L6 n=1 Tax=Candidatus Nomurabacteria bacterium RIFCSPLOWO2_12_FULL_44_11 TaxID=1801796 RepID=A0A1F6Y6F1_9BACT|nr:MAG: 50S ribosomal protein L6 [Candidatus Nomurabacteria bacterium RIFCSPLOWO2_12_FULL_44_11]OGJ08582.1 MAG: 50S ribosomal protein L6 [Candidatus Nomurabacteria bacterium RIFCSPLOWO2_02_FULL_44_12]